VSRDAACSACAGAEPELGSYFVSTYPPFSCWTAAGAEDYRRMLLAEPGGAAAAPPLGLYVHVPFCVERCSYCYYLSHDRVPERIQPYLEGLAWEAEALAAMPALAGRRPRFVYFGGGTPSVLSRAQIEFLLGRLRQAFDWSAAEEVTFECAPRSVTPQKLEWLRGAGVTRISMGVQQLDDDVLRRSGRVHEVADVRRAWEHLRRAAFPVVNLDLIVGLPGESDATFLRGLDEVIALGPESVTIYQLEIPRNTPLYRALERGEQEAPATWAVKRRRLDAGFSRLERAGYVLRSAYAAVRDPRRHRFVYQDEQYHGADLVGLGAAAFSVAGGVCQQNLATLDRYGEAVGERRLPLGRGLALGAAERLVREFILQLKLGGARADWFRRRHGVEILDRFAAPLADLARAGDLAVDASGVRLTRRGLLRADHLLPAFYLPEHRGIRYS